MCIHFCYLPACTKCCDQTHFHPTLQAIPCAHELTVAGNKIVVFCIPVSCPKEAPVAYIVAGVVGGILLLGLIILALIKAFFTMVVSYLFPLYFFIVI